MIKIFWKRLKNQMRKRHTPIKGIHTYKSERNKRRRSSSELREVCTADDHMNTKFFNSIANAFSHINQISIFKEELEVYDHHAHLSCICLSQRMRYLCVHMCVYVNERKSKKSKSPFHANARTSVCRNHL